jgi:hypothetical protein
MLGSTSHGLADNEADEGQRCLRIVTNRNIRADATSGVEKAPALRQWTPPFLCNGSQLATRNGGVLSGIWDKGKLNRPTPAGFSANSRQSRQFCRCDL